MVFQTRKSNRFRNLSSKAKQLQEQQQSQVIKKPILRSITTIDDDESTYNNISFKKRKTSPSPTTNVSNFDVSDYNNDIDDDDNIENELQENSDDENIFNSENDDDYYSALSDYESDSKPKFQTRKASISLSAKLNNSNNHNDLHDQLRISQNRMMGFEDALFDEEESESSDSTSTPTSTHFNFGSNDELKSLEENFQKIINENIRANQQTKQEFKTPIEVINDESTQDIKSHVKFDEFVNYTEDEESDLDSSEGESSSEQQQQQQRKQPSILHYRHDEKHNLAFPDVSTFPVRFDPMMKKKNTKNVRALNRRAILSGKASEMVGTGITAGDFGLF
ncbi:Midasin [Wickerhamomyces ciferrii]|uniref:Midasin n=1 Tax=Wickerhamomyces ciferrii (strain ATCC 14091 / BCRC 22168 / CBS 111 / JCM 3599 / NBRC 0793 / NRRL Y-1031 F-60-10) TaxID=1206466 RepID=K0KB20_WICCF|nr:Midasin [Wickerhamomyces ciferrii]CCH42195.1 Midasin [Wickerhamomyces ciferrii]